MGSLQKSNKAVQKVLDTELFKWPGTNRKWTIRDACQGTQVWGATGSGKSSASGRYLAKHFLENGFGGLVLVAKKDELDQWRSYAEDTGRLNDLVIFENQSPYQFNPLQYEYQRETEREEEAGETRNLLQILMMLYSMGKSFSSGGTGRDDERFWQNAMERCLSRSIDLLKMASQEVTFSNIRKVIVSALSEYDADQYITMLRNIQSSDVDPAEKVQEAKNLEAWEQSNFCVHCLVQAGVLSGRVGSKETKETNDLVQGYFLKEYARLHERTRSIISESALGILEPFITSGLLKRHFSSRVSDAMRPERAYEEGKIFIMNIPVKEYLLSGVYGQAIYKQAFQKAMERRTFGGNDPLRPVFIWSDEAQYFTMEGDALFATTARSSLVAIVNLTQNLSNYVVAMGGDNPKEKTLGLLGNLSTQIFHANSSFETNQYASKMIGQVKRSKSSVNIAHKKDGGSMSVSQSLEDQILPGDFTTLAKGGPANDLKAEGVVTQTGEYLGKDESFIKVNFDQQF